MSPYKYQVRIRDTRTLPSSILGHSSVNLSAFKLFYSLFNFRAKVVRIRKEMSLFTSSNRIKEGEVLDLQSKTNRAFAYPPPQRKNERVEVQQVIKFKGCTTRRRLIVEYLFRVLGCTTVPCKVPFYLLCSQYLPVNPI